MSTCTCVSKDAQRMWEYISIKVTMCVSACVCVCVCQHVCVCSGASDSICGRWSQYAQYGSVFMSVCECILAVI